MTDALPTSPAILNHNHIARLRNSPVARLLSGSIWVLKAWQLDMAMPPPVETWIDHQFSEALRTPFNETIDLDAVHIDFTTEEHPAVDVDGQERYELRLSLRELGRTLLEPEAFLALTRCAVEPERPLLDHAPGFTIQHLFRMLIKANWPGAYETLLRQFWQRYVDTWQLLAKCSFLHGLHRQYKTRKISRDSYWLGLNTMGIHRLPTTLDPLEASVSPQHSTVNGVLLNDEPIPGLFHVKSRRTGHCFVHLQGEQPDCLEYISDNAPWHSEKVLEILNRSPWHRAHLDLGDAPGHLTLGREIRGDLFTYLRSAQEQFSLDHLAVPSLLLLINPALTLISALDHWHSAAHLKKRIPTPLGVANRIMGKWLTQTLGRKVDPAHVFVRYLRGTSIRLWGHAQLAVNPEIVSPDETPVALDQALVQNFRERRPIGYDDEGGRWVVYEDHDGAGQWRVENEVPLTAAAVERHIRNIKFLTNMSGKLRRFWQDQSPAVERSLWSTLIGQALFNLKHGDLSTKGFNLLVSALQEQKRSISRRHTQWSAIGFYLDGGPVGGTLCPPCGGLLVLRHAGQPGGVLYQAGQPRAFVEFTTSGQLSEHLRRAAADPSWRATVLNYMPLHLHSSCNYILELWADLRRPPEPVSRLRPWTDRLYREAVYKAVNHEWGEQLLEGCPVSFILERLRSNSLSDAQSSIVTDRELLLDDLTRQLNRLQVLLAPLALLLPAAAIASLTASAASLALRVQAANLPGDRTEEKRQVLAIILSLGLLQLAPATPSLLRSFSRLATPTKLGGLAPPPPALRNFGLWLQHATQSRKTVLSRFFNGSGPLKNWRVAASRTFDSEPVRVWKLGRKFLLWTSDRSQARTLVVSSHGYYFPWTRTTAVPNGTELRTYAPHGHVLIDPGLHKVVSQSVLPYAKIDSTQPQAGPATMSFSSLVEGDTLMAGTTLSGHIKNYSLAKYQSDTYESYRDISQIVSNSYRSPLPAEIPATPMDVLTVRNRFGMAGATLEDLFEQLHRHGIHYDKILLVHCRCSVISASLGLAPRFVPDTAAIPISP